MDKFSKLSNAGRHENNSEPSFLNQLGPLLILSSIFFINFVSRITPAPLVPRIEMDLNLSHADAGALFLVISLGYFIYFRIRFNQTQFFSHFVNQCLKFFHGFVFAKIAINDKQNIIEDTHLFNNG